MCREGATVDSIVSEKEVTTLYPIGLRMFILQDERHKVIVKFRAELMRGTHYMI